MYAMADDRSTPSSKSNLNLRERFLFFIPYSFFNSLFYFILNFFFTFSEVKLSYNYGFIVHLATLFQILMSALFDWTTAVRRVATIPGSTAAAVWPGTAWIPPTTRLALS